MWVQYSLLSFRWLRWQACSPQKYCFKRNQRTKDVLIQGSPTGSWVKLLRNLSWKDINNPWTCSWCRELNSSPKTQDFFLGGGGLNWYLVCIPKKEFWSPDPQPRLEPQKMQVIHGWWEAKSKKLCHTEGDLSFWPERNMRICDKAWTTNNWMLGLWIISNCYLWRWDLSRPTWCWFVHQTWHN